MLDFLEMVRPQKKPLVEVSLADPAAGECRPLGGVIGQS